MFSKSLTSALTCCEVTGFLPFLARDASHESQRENRDAKTIEVHVVSPLLSRIMLCKIMFKNRMWNECDHYPLLVSCLWSFCDIVFSAPKKSRARMFAAGLSPRTGTSAAKSCNHALATNTTVLTHQNLCNNKRLAQSPGTRTQSLLTVRNLGWSVRCGIVLPLKILAPSPNQWSVFAWGLWRLRRCCLCLTTFLVWEQNRALFFAGAGFVALFRGTQFAINQCPDLIRFINNKIWNTIYS